MGAPLLWQGQATGVINVMRSADQAGFTDYDVQTLTIFASQAAVVVENARLLDTTQHYASELEQRVSERTAALRAANIKLQELDTMKNEFVSNISHELRTPLANIKLYLRLLETGRAEKQPQYLATLHKESALLQFLFDQVDCLFKVLWVYTGIHFPGTGADSRAHARRSIISQPGLFTNHLANAPHHAKLPKHGIPQRRGHILRRITLRPNHTDH